MNVLTQEQVTWLTQHGGRSEKDVLVDSEGPFVIMYKPSTTFNPLTYEHVYLPK